MNDEYHIFASIYAVMNHQKCKLNKPHNVTVKYLTAMKTPDITEYRSNMAALNIESVNLTVNHGKEMTHSINSRTETG